MNKKMKTKNITILLFLLCTNLCFAQNKLFGKYADMDHVTSVYISKAMFQLMPTMEAGGLNLMNLKGKIESLQILSTENVTTKEQMKKEFSNLINDKYEELMRVKDGGTKATFYIKKKGEQISELIMLADTDREYSVIQILGNFSLKDIQSIAAEVNK